MTTRPRAAKRLPAAPRSTFSWIACAALLSTLLLLGGCTGKGQAEETNAAPGESASETSSESSSADASSADAEATVDGAKEGDKEDEEDLVPVEAVALEHGAIESVLRYSTNLEAESEVQVFSQAARLVTELRVEEGDPVRRGQVLVRLQDEEQRSQVERVSSQLEKAKREYERQKSLYSQELISEQTFYDATYELEQLELSYADAERELGYTEVRAPISGILTQRLVNLGDHITVNQHLFDIVDFDSIVARVFVPEAELPRLAVKQSARIFSASLGGEARAGEINRVAPVVDPQSGTVKVTVDVPRGQGLRPGMYVEVELITETREDALLVPKRAVVYDDDRQFVFRLGDDMVVERIWIESRLEDQSSIEPTGDALAAGDRIVVAGQAGLKDGTKVRMAGDKPQRTAETTESAP